MKRYQQLIQSETARLYDEAEQERQLLYGNLYKPNNRNQGYFQLSQQLGAPTTSVHEWGKHTNKVPSYKSLEKIAAYFKVPLPTLLMEVDETQNHDDLIIEALCTLGADEKQQIVELIEKLKTK